jgi:hypothetical protein
MVKLSPPRFYVEIICNFNITCKSGRPNLISVKISNFALFFSRICRKPPVFGNHPSEKLSPHRKILKIHLIFFKLAHTNTTNKLGHFFGFQVEIFNLKLEI